MTGTDLTVSASTTIDGVAETPDGGIDWNEQTVVQIDDAPYREYFETDSFYEFDVVAARPIEQEYQHDGDTLTARKPPAELRKAQWQLDNLPYVLEHPDMGIVTQDTTIHGFTRNPRYVELDGEPDEQRVKLYVPTNDEEAKTFLEQHRDVSPGYFDDWDFDVDDDSVDFHQRNLTYDHLAGVVHGRCSSEDGCLVELDSVTDDAGSAPIVGTVSPAEDHGCSPGPCSCGRHVEDASGNTTVSDCRCGKHVTVDAPDGIYIADGEWFAVASDEHTKESTDHTDDAMFPIGGCSNVDDAWQLRGHTSNLKIDDSTLEARIRRAAEAQDCDLDTSTTDSFDTMSETDDDGDADDGGMSAISVGDLTVDAIAAQNDDVADLRQRVEELETERDAARDRAAELESHVLDSKRDAYEQHVSDLTDLTDHWDEDALLERFDADSEDFDVDTADSLISDVEDKLAGVKAALDDVDTDSESDDGSVEDDEEATTMGTSEATADAADDGDVSDGPEFLPETA
jgi:hypothetical protein